MASTITDSGLCLRAAIAEGCRTTGTTTTTSHISISKERQMARKTNTQAMEQHSTLNQILKALRIRRNSPTWDNRETPTDRHPGRPADRIIMPRAHNRIPCRTRRPDRRLPRHITHQILDRTSPIRLLLSNNASNRRGQAVISMIISIRQLRIRTSGRLTQRRMRTPTISSSHNLPASRPITRPARMVTIPDIVE